MQAQVLSPGVQDAEEADPGSEMPGIGCNFKHGLGGGAEEQIVEQARMSLTERIERVRQSKDEVEVGHGEQILLTPRKPALTRLRLTLGTVPVAARVVGNGLEIAPRTGVQMTSESSSAASGDGPQDAELLVAKPGTVLFSKAVTLDAKDIGHLHGGPIHLSFFR
jgi:hypothetical protein